MWNVIDQIVSYLDPGIGLSKHACASAGACEIVSGYMPPNAEADPHARPAGSSRKQAGILYADAAGSAGRSGLVEDEFQSHLEAAMKILMANIARNGGRLVSMEGYAILAEFEDTDQGPHGCDCGGPLSFVWGLSFGGSISAPGWQTKSPLS